MPAARTTTTRTAAMREKRRNARCRSGRSSRQPIRASITSPPIQSEAAPRCAQSAATLAADAFDLNVAGRTDVRFVAAELVEREGGSVRRRLVGGADLVPSAGAGLGAELSGLMQRLRQPRAAVAGVALDRPRMMGIVNVTPDSFSDGGRWLDPEAAIAHALQLEAEGA